MNYLSEKRFTGLLALLIAAPLLAAIVLLTSPAFGAEWEIKGNATGSLYHKDSFKWTEEPIRVFAVYDKKYLDDATYIVGGTGENETTGILTENGQPGQANVESNFERKKFVSLLKKSQGWLITASREQVQETSYQSRIFRSFNVDLVPGLNGRENSLRIKIKDHQHNKRLVLHLNAYQIGQLRALLEQVPDVLTEMAVKYGKRKMGAGLQQ